MTKLTTLTDASLALLRAVAAGGDLTARALAERTSQTAKNIPRGLARLEAAGLIAGEPPRMTEGGDAVLALADGATATPPAPPSGDGFAEVPLDLIDRDPTLNPRTIFDDEELESLAASIRDKGVAQPILLRQGLAEGRFRIVAGERRFRASQKAGKAAIPAMIRQLTDDQALEIATIENIQRVNLSPLEEANAFTAIIAARMRADPGLALKDAKAIIADAVRKTVRYVEQRMDLLVLPAILQKRLELEPDHDGHLSLKEARNQVQKIRAAARSEEAAKLTPELLLAMAETLDAMTRHQGCYVNTTRIGLEPDDALDQLVAKGLITVTHLYDDPTYRHVRLVNCQPDRIERQLKAATEAGTLDALRKALRPDWRYGEDYITLWLRRGEIQPEAHLVAQEEERLARTAEAAAQRKADDEARSAARAEHLARAERDLGHFGKDLLATVRNFELPAPTMSHAAFTAAFASIHEQFGIAGPYTVHLSEDGTFVEYLDGQGHDTVCSGFTLEARKRLITIALNYCSGLSPFSGPDLETPWSKAAATAAPEPHDGLADDDDAEIPDTLRNLAGPGAQVAEPVE